MAINDLKSCRGRYFVPPYQNDFLGPQSIFQRLVFSEGFIASMMSVV